MTKQTETEWGVRTLNGRCWPVASRQDAEALVESWGQVEARPPMAAVGVVRRRVVTLTSEWSDPQETVGLEDSCSMD